MTQLQDYQNKYSSIRMRREGGVLEMTFHTEGRSFQWGLVPHAELPDAFQDVTGDRENKVIIMTGTGQELLHSPAAVELLSRARAGRRLPPSDS